MTAIENPTGPATAHTRDELMGVLRRPQRLLELVLVQRDRLHASIARAEHLWWLVGSLAAGTVLYALPFGAVLGLARSWRVAALLLGSVAICVPSLHVVGAFIGSRLRLAQTLCLALVISSVAALFTFGFFPIVWFLDATMEEGSFIDAGSIATVLWCISLAAGVTQFLRSQHAVSLLREFKPTFRALLVGWLGLLVFITARLAMALGL